MNGRVPRTKSPAQLVAELEALRQHGWKEMVFVVDDNFIGDKRRTRALLRELIEWRRRTRPSMNFLTEASVNLADDEELCALMVEAGFMKVFVGIETPSAERWRNAASSRTRAGPGGRGADAATARVGGDGWIHRGFRQRSNGHLQATV